MVGWLKVVGSKNDKETNEGMELHRQVFEDIRKSHEEWKLAHCMFEEALEQDQIDYAIFTMEAAERRYQMHLRRAKQFGICGSTQAYANGMPYSNLSKRVEGSH